MPNIDLSILNQRQTPAFYADVFANRPAAGFVGRIFVSTDTYAFYRDNGTGWDLIGGPGTGTVTGSGAAGQVAFWSGSSLISGENNLWWDSVNNHFGINTNTPGTAADIHHDQSTILQLNQTTATNDTRIAFQNSGTSLWRIGNFYNAGANDLGIFDVVGNIQPLTIKKTTGQTFIGAETTTSGRLVVNTSTSDNHIVVIGANAPSLRINNGGVGSTRRIGLGLATASNNFIQGTTGGELCLFNSSTTPSPILFGIYDTGTSQTIEAGRVSSLTNFLLGQTADTGEKLQVTGNVKITGTLSATSLGITGGTANTLLATNGSTISAGTNITISGGTISAASTTYTAGTGIDITGSVISSTITQYTDANARASLSAGTGISYNSSTGQISSTITQYTDANARASLSFSAGSGAYNSSTGVITIPTNTNQLTNGSAFITLASLSAGTGISYNSSTGQISSTITQYTDANARASLSFSAGSGAYNSSTGVITIPTNTNQLTNGSAFITLASLSAGTGISYNSSTGVISSTITQYTDANARASLSAGTGISYNSSTGQISSTITQYTDANARASLSFAAGSGAYNNSTGVITIPTNTNQLTNGSAFITRASLSAGTGISYNSSTGVITNTLTSLSGTYAPTVSGSNNLASGFPIFFYDLMYNRVGNVVYVAGQVFVGIVSGNGNMQISLPISTNFNSVGDLSGVTTAMSGSTGYLGTIAAYDNVGQLEANITFVGADPFGCVFYFNFSYIVN